MDRESKTRVLRNERNNDEIRSVYRIFLLEHPSQPSLEGLSISASILSDLNLLGCNGDSLEVEEEGLRESRTLYLILSCISPHNHLRF